MKIKTNNKTNKQTNKRENKSKSTQKHFVLCWPSTLGHGVCPEVDVPSDTPFEKMDSFPLPRVSIVNSFLVRNRVGHMAQLLKAKFPTENIF